MNYISLKLLIFVLSVNILLQRCQLSYQLHFWRVEMKSKKRINALDSIRWEDTACSLKTHETPRVPSITFESKQANDKVVHATLTYPKCVVWQAKNREQQIAASESLFLFPFYKLLFTNSFFLGKNSFDIANLRIGNFLAVSSTILFL